MGRCQAAPTPLTSAGLSWGVSPAPCGDPGRCWGWGGSSRCQGFLVGTAAKGETQSSGWHRFALRQGVPAGGHEGDEDG